MVDNIIIELGQALPAAGALLALGLSSTVATRAATKVTNKLQQPKTNNHNNNNGQSHGSQHNVNTTGVNVTESTSGNTTSGVNIPSTCPASTSYTGPIKRSSIIARSAAPKNENAYPSSTSTTTNMVKASSSASVKKPEPAKAPIDGTISFTLSMRSPRVIMKGWRDICTHWKLLQPIIVGKILEPSTLLTVAAISITIAWFMLFSWTSLMIQGLAMISLLCVMTSIYQSCRLNGLLTFAPPIIRRLLTELSLMDIAQIPWNSQLITDIATLFVFRLSETERRQILRQLPHHIRSTLQTKGLVNLLPPTIKPLVTPHPAASSSSITNTIPTITHVSPIEPSPAPTSVTSTNYGDAASPLISITSETKRGWIPSTRSYLPLLYFLLCVILLYSHS
jgi:hypothetical protein